MKPIFRWANGWQFTGWYSNDGLRMQFRDAMGRVVPYVHDLCVYP